MHLIPTPDVIFADRLGGTMSAAEIREHILYCRWEEKRLRRAISPHLMSSTLRSRFSLTARRAGNPGDRGRPASGRNALELARVLLERAASHLRFGEYGRSMAAARRAVRLLRKAGVDPIRVRACSNTFESMVRGCDGGQRDITNAIIAVEKTGCVFDEARFAADNPAKLELCEGSMNEAFRMLRELAGTIGARRWI